MTAPPGGTGPGDAGAGPGTRPEAALGVAEALMSAEEDVRYPIGAALPLGVLRSVDFLERQGYARQVEELSRSDHVHFRRVRPDGDSFYRALCFAWLEVVRDRAGRGKLGKSLLPGSWPDQALFGELAELYSELREQVMEVPSRPQVAQTLLARLMIDYRFDLCAVAFVRLLVAAFWCEGAAHGGSAQVHAWAAEVWADEVARHGGVEEFVRSEVLPMGKEAKGPSIAAAAAQLGVQVSILQLDGSPGPPSERAYPPWDGGKSKPVIRLVRRSASQYEVVYRRETPVFEVPESFLARCSACHEQAELSARGLLGCTHRLCVKCAGVESECSVCLQDKMERSALSTLELAQGCLPDDVFQSEELAARQVDAETEEVIGLLRSLGNELADEGAGVSSVSPQDKSRMQGMLAKRRALIEGDPSDDKGASNSPLITDGRTGKPSRKSRIQCAELTKALDRAVSELQKLTVASGRTSEELAQCSAARREAQFEAVSLKAELRTEEGAATGLSEECVRAEVACTRVRSELREHAERQLQVGQEGLEAQREQWREEQEELLRQLSDRSVALESTEAARASELEALVQRVQTSEHALRAEESALEARDEAAARQEAAMQQRHEEQERLLRRLSESTAALEASEASLAAEENPRKHCEVLEQRLLHSNAETARMGETVAQLEAEVQRLASLQLERTAMAAHLEEELHSRASEAQTELHAGQVGALERAAASDMAEVEAHESIRGRLELARADRDAEAGALQAELASRRSCADQLAASCERHEALSAHLREELGARDAEHAEERERLLRRVEEQGEVARQPQDAASETDDAEREALSARLDHCTASLRSEEAALQASYTEQSLVVDRCLRVAELAENKAAKWEMSCTSHGNRARELEEAMSRAAAERAALLHSLQAAEAAHATAESQLEKAAAASASASPHAELAAEAEPAAEDNASPHAELVAEAEPAVEEPPPLQPEPPGQEQPEPRGLDSNCAAAALAAPPRPPSRAGVLRRLGRPWLVGLAALAALAAGAALVLPAGAAAAARPPRRPPAAAGPAPEPPPTAPSPEPSNAPAPAPVPTFAPLPGGRVDVTEVRRLERELEAQRLRREALAQAAASSQRRAAAARAGARRARAALGAAWEDAEEAQRELASEREQLRELKASGAGSQRADESLGSAIEQGLLAVLAGVLGLVSVLGPDKYFKGFNAIAGSAFGGLLVGSAAVFLSGLLASEAEQHVPAAVQSLLDGEGCTIGYALWAIMLALGAARWFSGFECSLYANADEVVVTSEGVMVVQPDNDLRRLGRRPTVCLPLRRPAWL